MAGVFFYPIGLRRRLEAAPALWVKNPAAQGLPIAAGLTEGAFCEFFNPRLNLRASPQLAGRARVNGARESDCAAGRGRHADQLPHLLFVDEERLKLDLLGFAHGVCSKKILHALGRG